MTHYYSPYTGEYIDTATPADWMKKTEVAPPPFDPAAEGLFFRDGSWVIDPSTMPPVNVPQCVTMRQARLALLYAGLLGAVQAAVAAAPQAVQIEWEFAATVDRNWPMLAVLQSALGLSDAQIDALFITAGAL